MPHRNPTPPARPAHPSPKALAEACAAFASARAARARSLGVDVDALPALDAAEEAAPGDPGDPSDAIRDVARALMRGVRAEARRRRVLPDAIGPGVAALRRLAHGRDVVGLVLDTLADAGAAVGILDGAAVIDLGQGPVRLAEAADAIAATVYACARIVPSPKALERVIGILVEDSGR